MNNINGAVKIYMITSIRIAYTMVFHFLYNRIILVGWNDCNLEILWNIGELVFLGAQSSFNPS